MILLTHPSGNTFFRAAARAFYSAGILAELHSCICWDPSSIASKFLPRSLQDNLSRRTFSDIPLSLQHSHPLRELGRLFSQSYNLSPLISHEIGPFSVDSVYRSFDRHVASLILDSSRFTAVYAYEDAALATFQAANKRDMHCIYDLPIGYWRAAQIIYAEERQIQPEWASTLTGLNDSQYKLDRKDVELSLADLIVVPSNFVLNTLVKYSEVTAPIVVVPFGSPLPSAQPIRLHNGPLRVLYVGSLGQRKGLSYLLDAVQLLAPKVQLTLIGRPTSRDCVPLNKALSQHTWIKTLSHPLILKQMRLHDVLVLPSLFEGFALVINEAISQGIPVVTTPNSGADVAIRDGLEGFIVPIRDSAAIANRLCQLADDPELRVAMSMACLRRAAELTWKHYETKLTSLAIKFCSV